MFQKLGSDYVVSLFSLFSSLINISTHSSSIAFHTQLANHAISYSYKLFFIFDCFVFSMFVSLLVCGHKNVYVEQIRNVYSQFIMKTYAYLQTRVV